MGPVISAALGFGSKLVGAFNKKTKAKTTIDTINARAQASKESGDNKVTLTDAEWENVQAANQNNTWKDEYITVIVTAPYPLLLVGGIYFIFTGDERLMTGATAGLNAIQATGVNTGMMMTAAVFAALGLKMWRR